MHAQTKVAWGANARGESSVCSVDNRQLWKACFDVMLGSPDGTILHTNVTC